MALRTKTIEYAFSPFVGGTTNAAYTSLGSITVDIPETASRTILAAWVDIDAANLGTVALNTFTRFLTRVTIAATTPGTVDYVKTFTPPAAIGAYAFSIPFDFTSTFQSSFTGTSQSVKLEVWTEETGSGSKGLAYPSGRLFITYQYDDASEATLIKTVRIPIQSAPTTISAATVTVGTLPALATYLPEGGKVIKQVFFELETYDARAATDPSQASITIGAFNTPINYNYGDYHTPRTVRTNVIWPAASLTAATTAIQFSGTNSNFRVSLVAVVTYTYAPASTTRVLNAIMLVGHEEEWCQPETSATQTDTNFRQQVNFSFHIPEPGTITLRNSGLKLWCAMSPKDTNGYFAWQPGVGDLRQQIGGFTDVSGLNRNTGVVPSFGRLDTATAAFTPVRGANSLSVAYYTYRYDSAHRFGSPQFILYLNYESDKAAAGCDAHNHTVLFPAVPMTMQNEPASGSNPTANITPMEGAVLPAIADSVYYASGFFFQGASYYVGKDVTTPASVSTGVKRSAANGGAYKSTTVKFIQQLSLQCMWFATCANELFKQCSKAAVDSRLAYNETGMKFRLSGPTSDTQHGHMRVGITYHAITYTVAGVLSGFSGDGSGVVVTLHDAATGAVLQTMTTAAGGAYSFAHYDNVSTVYVSAYQDATHLGRSAASVAV